MKYFVAVFNAGNLSQVGRVDIVKNLKFYKTNWTKKIIYSFNKKQQINYSI